MIFYIRRHYYFSSMGDKKKIVALLSGGLDSQLAVKMMQKQGFEVEAVAIKTPFCDFDCGRGCGFEIRERADDLNVKLKTVYLGDEYIEMLKHPKHGFGAGMNPCIDCRAMMFKAAKKHMEDIGAEFVISGEVVGQRPMSQHRPALRTIEKESELEDKIVRPLSAALLPKTAPEIAGLIKREDLGMIKGRSRKPQLQMAKEFGIQDPPNAGGGCLLKEQLICLIIPKIPRLIRPAISGAVFGSAAEMDVQFYLLIQILSLLFEVQVCADSLVSDLRLRRILQILHRYLPCVFLPP